MSDEIETLKKRVDLLESVVLALVEMPAVNLSPTISRLMPALGFDYFVSPERGGYWERRRPQSPQPQQQ